MLWNNWKQIGGFLCGDSCMGTHSPLTILLLWDKGKVGKILISEAKSMGT